MTLWMLDLSVCFSFKWSIKQMKQLRAVGNYGYLPIFEDFQVSYKIAYEDGEFGEEIFETYTTDSLASVDYTTLILHNGRFFSTRSYTIEMSTHMPTIWMLKQIPLQELLSLYLQMFVTSFIDSK